jgi:hypothetical protein
MYQLKLTIPPWSGGKAEQLDPTATSFGPAGAIASQAPWLTIR